MTPQRPDDRERADTPRWYDADWRLIGIVFVASVILAGGIVILIAFGWPPTFNRDEAEGQIALDSEPSATTQASIGESFTASPPATLPPSVTPTSSSTPTQTPTPSLVPSASPTLTPTNAQVQELLTEAFALDDAYQYAAAIEVFTDVLALEPNNVQALVGRADAYCSDFYWHESEADYRTALELDPNYAKGYYGLINLYLRERNYSAAFQVRDAAEERFSDDPYFYLVAGSSYFEVGDYQTAYEYSDEAIWRGEETATAYSARGAALSWLRRDEEALDDYNTAITLDPTFPYAYLNRARLERRYEMIDEALADIQKAIDVDPQNPSVHCRVGEYYTKYGDLEAAIQAFSAGIAVHDRAFSCRLKRAYALSDLERFEEALADTRYVIEQQPDFTTAYDNLGNLYIDMLNWAEAVDAFTVIITTGPYANAYWNRGYCYLRLGDYEAALADLDRAIWMYSGTGGYYYDRAVAHLHLGQLQEALSDIDQVLAINPGYIPSADTDEYGNFDPDPFHPLIQAIYWEHENETDEAVAAYRTFINKYTGTDEILNYAQEHLADLE